MKLKKIVTLLGSAIGVIGLSTNVMATEITMPIKADSTLNTISGYIAEVTYNPLDLTPVITGNDILNDENYAESNIPTGYLAADLVEPGKIVVGWADKSAFDLGLDNVLANVTFNVNGDTTSTETTVTAKLFQIARYPDIMSENEINYSENFVIGKSDSADSDADTVESGSSVIISSGDYVVENPDLIIQEDETVNQEDETLSATSSTVKIE